MQKKSENENRNKNRNENNQKNATNTISRLKNDLSWHAENAALVGQNEEKMREMQLEVRRLQEQLQKYKSSKGPSPMKPSLAARKIRMLEKRIQEQDDALRRRHPDSLSNLIRAVGPSEEEMTFKNAQNQ